MNYDYDFIIVGSGFGGSVSALRLAEKGYSVCVIERGKRFNDADFPKTNWNLRKYLWMPRFKCFGIQNMSLFKNILILSGAGVGGGSLVYANTLIQPSDDFYEAEIWKGLAPWKEELAPHYKTAKKMLGVATNPRLTDADRILQECAKDLGKEDTFKPTEVGVFFGEPGTTVPDPYFGGQGPERKGCIFCGGCMVGCRHNAKNTLVKNYLYFAEKLGVRIIPERNVVDIKPISSETHHPANTGEKDQQSLGYEILTEDITSWFKKSPKTLRAKNVILSGGVLGTIQLLLNCKYITRSLPKLSDQIGHHVRTNSEALVGVTEFASRTKNDHSEGIAISSIFHPDPYTHVEPVRYPKGSDFMRVLAAPMADDGGPWIRPLKLLWASFRHPIDTLRALFQASWAQRSIVLLVMQNVDNKMRFQLGRNIFTFFRKQMTTAPEEGQYRIPAYIPIANQIGREFAKKVNGIPMSTVNEVLLNIPATAHILGGCTIGKNPERGVIDQNHQVFHYPGLYVCDGSAIPANLGVNPSLTITAMTERAMEKIPAKLNR